MIFAEFSCEGYSYDSFNSKAEVVFDTYCLRENYSALPKMFVERDFRQNIILAPIASDILQNDTRVFSFSSLKFYPKREGGFSSGPAKYRKILKTEIALSFSCDRAIIRTGLHTLSYK